jgi:magnesium transporter
MTETDPAAASPPERAPRDTARSLAVVPEREAVEALLSLRNSVALETLEKMDDERREAVLAATHQPTQDLWRRGLHSPKDTVGRLMEPPAAVFRPDDTVATATATLRELVKRVFVTYSFVTDEENRLVGVITFRDLLFSDESTTLGGMMLRTPFALRPDMDLADAMKQVVNRHFPVYPVVDETGRLIGQVRGQVLFEERVIDISLQAGTMVGVVDEERLATPWPRSLRFRHPWLQLNLLTAFLAAAVVGIFQGTIDRLVILAMFLPVLAGQSGNTGCQALAVTLRGMTLGELRKGAGKTLVGKEALLGLLNGGLVGISAALGMLFVARAQGNPEALVLSVVVFVAMIGSCVISGLSGALIPLTLKRLGADPATASSIFLTTATDVASMGILLGLATVLVR